MYNNLTVESELNDLKIVQCRIEFFKIGKVDTFNEEFAATVKIRSKWYENEIINKYNPELHWNPKLFVENAVPDLQFFQEISYKSVIKEDTTEITELRICKGEKQSLRKQNSD